MGRGPGQQETSQRGSWGQNGHLLHSYYSLQIPLELTCSCDPTPGTNYYTAKFPRCYMMFVFLILSAAKYSIARICHKYFSSFLPFVTIFPSPLFPAYCNSPMFFSINSQNRDYKSKDYENKYCQISSYVTHNAINIFSVSLNIFLKHVKLSMQTYATVERTA